MNALKDIEVEITLTLLNGDEVIATLQKLGAKHNRDEYQKDTYYVPPHKNFLDQRPISDWLRIRQTEHDASVTFKRWHNKDNKQAISCDEFETKIEKAEQLHNIFTQLDIKDVVAVEKKRTTYHYGDVEIAIDRVTDLGTYIEIEAKGEFTSIQDAEKHLYAVLKEINAKTGEQDYKGYPHLLLEKKGYNLD